jgi:hypothetical protein
MSTTDTSADASPVARQFVPYTFYAGRLSLSLITSLLVIFIVLGFAGLGPAHNLVNVTNDAFKWITSWSGLSLP